MFARKYIVWALIAVCLIAAVVSLAQPALAATTCQAIVTVRPGNTLAGFADKYDVRFEDLAKANHLYQPYYTIYVNQNLCIPKTSKPYTSNPKTATAPAADYTAHISGKDLVINTTYFPKQSAYYVKVGSAGSKAKQKIGQLNTKTGGSLEGVYALPDKMKNATEVSVCVKNNVSDANVCRVAKR
jgi:LysM domain